MAQKHVPVKTIMTSSGYGIRKDALTSDEIRKIKKELTVRPFVPPGAPVKPPAFQVFGESPQRVWVPREWGRQEFGEANKIKVMEGEDRPEGLRFNGDLRPYQKEILSDWTKDVVPSSVPEGRILTVPCGYGKTVMSLWCASKVQKKTMVVVHKEFLMNQFKEEIGRFLPHAKIGRVQGNIFDIEDKDIVIVMLQSLISRQYPANAFHSFGMVIFDECHHLAAEVFSRVLLMLGMWRMLGLSATPKRKDNLSKVFHWHIGDFLAKIENRKKENVDVWVMRHKVPVICGGVSDPYLDEPKTMTDQVSLPKLITRVSEREDRSAIIAEITAHLVTTEERQVLILGDRKALLQWFYEKLTSKTFHNGIFENDVGYYVGGMKQDALAISATKKIVLGTFAMASEGMNIPSLDTLILATPKSDVIQSVGRILRKKIEDRRVTPLVIDILDPHPSLQRQYKKRKATYKKYDYTIKDLVWNPVKRIPIVKMQSSKGRSKIKDIEDNIRETKECLLLLD